MPHILLLLRRPKFWIFIGLPIVFSVAIAIFFPSRSDGDGYSSSFERAMASRCEMTLLPESPLKNSLPADPVSAELLRRACFCFVKGANERLSWRQRGTFYGGQAQNDPVVLAIVKSELQRCAVPLRMYWAEH